MVRADGTISDKENKKYAHRHKNLPNPAKKAGSKQPERTVSPEDEVPDFDDGFEPPDSTPKAAPKPKPKRRAKSTTRAAPTLLGLVNVRVGCMYVHGCIIVRKMTGGKAY